MMHPGEQVGGQGGHQRGPAVIRARSHWGQGVTHTLHQKHWSNIYLNNYGDKVQVQHECDGAGGGQVEAGAVHVQVDVYVQVEAEDDGGGQVQHQGGGSVKCTNSNAMVRSAIS